MNPVPLLGLNLMQMGARHPVGQQHPLFTQGLLRAMSNAPGASWENLFSSFAPHRGGAGPAAGSFRAAQEAGVTPSFEARQLLGK